MGRRGMTHCDHCGHYRSQHPDRGPRPCTAKVYQYIASNSGPGTSIPRPCPCPGYTPRKVTMMPEPAAPAAPAPPPAAASEVHQVLHDLQVAYEQSHTAMMSNHQLWMDAVKASHTSWITKLEQLSARLAQAAGGQGDGGPQ